VTNVEWHPGELYPRVGFIVTNLARPAEGVVAFYNQHATAEQHIKEGKNAIKWTRLLCCTFAANAIRLQLHALAYNLGNFMQTLATPKTAEAWSLISLREKLIKIGARVVSHGRYVTFVPDVGGRCVPSDVQRNHVADRPAAGRRPRQHDGGCVVRCDGRPYRVRLGGRTVTCSNTTRRPPIVSDGQQNIPAVHSSGRSRLRLVNLPNIAAYVVARIVLVPLSGQASGEF
jgi:hypothetical protein